MVAAAVFRSVDLVNAMGTEGSLVRSSVEMLLVGRAAGPLAFLIGSAAKYLAS